MERWPLVVILSSVWATTLEPAGARPPSALDNSCVDCHRRTDTIRALPPWRQDQFLHWFGSVHGRQDVTCDKCHGGDPERLDAEAAHVGIKPSSDKSSSVYYKNLPATCGACHEEVSSAFTRSHHSEHLKSDLLAPSCTTCHGFDMAIDRPDPSRTVERCKVCHAGERGTQTWVVARTREIFEEVEALRSNIRETQVAVDLADENKVAPKDANATLHEARDRLRKTGAFWHEFALSKFESELQSIRADVDSVRTATRQALRGR